MIISSIYYNNQSLKSSIPPLVMANTASDSGRLGESYILHTLDSPLPFLKYNL